MRTTRAANIVAAGIALAVTAALSACGSTTTGSKQTLNVFGAASLKTAFTALGTDFEAAHPGATVNFDFDSSTILAQQITDNPGTADVFASADEKNMQKLQDAGQVTGTPTVFAKNQMEIAVEPGNPQQVKTVSDLANPKLAVALCASEAPCGKYADQLLEQDSVKVTPKSRELNATSTLGKVVSGDADAAIVYVTDAKASGTAVAVVPIPAWQNAFAIYPIAPIAASTNADLANAWITYVTSATGQKTLQSFGFLPPPPAE